MATGIWTAAVGGAMMSIGKGWGGTPKSAYNKYRRWQQPRDIDRIDKPHTDLWQYHVHQKKTDASYNVDGSLHDKKKWIPNFSKKTIQWLKDHWWNIK
jgi:hypothetical protein